MKNRIQELRKERRVTQSELADAVEVTRQTIISLENGKYNASLILAHKIAQYFGMNIEDISSLRLPRCEALSPPVQRPPRW